MRWSVRRTLFGAAVLLAGIVYLNQTETTVAADPVPDSEFKGLVEQDAKNILSFIERIDKAKDKKVLDKRANVLVVSDAMMIAMYAQSQITGKNADADAKYATLRDAAIKVAKEVKKKDRKLAEVAKLAKNLSADMQAAKGVSAKPIKLSEAVEFDIDDLMFQYKTTVIGGIGVEKSVKDNAKKLTLKNDEAALLALRVMAVCDYSETVKPEFNATKTEKMWDGFNKDTREAAKVLYGASKGKEPKKIQSAFDKLDGACTACHNVFKKT
jgi:hypothetical protein